MSRYLDGLSPRGRGNPLSVVRSDRPQRSIPAWAGEPFSLRPNPAMNPVYPRVGGGTWIMDALGVPATGLSPRGRGNRQDNVLQQQIMGSIPAWAGEPLTTTKTTMQARVYPRVGGGTDFLGSVLGVESGLSPRGRGNPAFETLDLSLGRSIPAWAGEPPKEVETDIQKKVYPRVGGGTPVKSSWKKSRTGLSPRGRGNLGGSPDIWLRTRSIPAWAGEPLAVGDVVNLDGVYPRVGGGTFVENPSPVDQTGLSPRGRGNLPQEEGCVGVCGSIPAWAGEPRCSPSKRTA